jgi:ankyrin repeat protein
VQNQLRETTPALAHWGILTGKDREAASVPDNDGLTPLTRAMDRPRCIDAVKALVEVGGVRVNQQGRTRGRPVLSWAATEGYIEIVEYLLTVPGIEENLRDNDGRTPLSYATTNGRLDVVKILTKRDRLDVRLSDSSAGHLGTGQY